MTKPAFVLVHSPLVGPLTWEPVAAELRRQGFTAFVPSLRLATAAPPYWGHQAETLAALIFEAGLHEPPPVLVGHSGASLLLPFIRVVLGSLPVRAYIFVDSDLPHKHVSEPGSTPVPDWGDWEPRSVWVDWDHRMSRLDHFSDPTDAAAFRATADPDGLLPTWTEEDLADAIPDPELRRRYVADLQPTPLALYEEQIPMVAGWPDAPCGYIHFSPPYDAAAAEARVRGIPVINLPGSHFRLLTDPVPVAAALIRLAG